MKTYTVIVKDEVFDDINLLADYIISLSTAEHAEAYTRMLVQEIQTLEYLAAMIPFSPWELTKEYHPYAKAMVSRNRKWCIIFHIDGTFAVIDKLLPASMLIK